MKLLLTLLERLLRESGNQVATISQFQTLSGAAVLASVAARGPAWHWALWRQQ